MWLLVAFLAGPLIEATCRDDAAPLLESVAEHWFVGDGFRAGVERRRHLLRRFLPPAGNEAPAHRHQLALAVLIEADHVNGRRRRNVVAGLKIARRAKYTEKRMHFFP